jgi:glutamate--cysteine ligase
MHVTGDGKHTVAELVERKNAERSCNPAYARFPLCLTKKEITVLREAGLGIDHVPAAEQSVFLRRRPNEDEARDITDEIHPSYVTCVERALSLLPSLVWCGVDMIIPDIAAAATSDNYYILELNAPARFVDHLYPWRGQSRDVASLILDCLENTWT